MALAGWVRRIPRLIALAALTAMALPTGSTALAAPVPPWADQSADQTEQSRSRLPAPDPAPGFQPAPPSDGSRLAALVSAAPGSAPAVPYRDLIRSSAAATGADTAAIAALMEVESSGVCAVSPAGAVGLMQLMPDKFLPGDNPCDPATNIFRAAQHIRRLQDRWGSLDSVAAAYFGAIDGKGNATGATDGAVSGFEYVARFRAAYQRYAGR